jgi:hypothetical protein
MSHHRIRFADGHEKEVNRLLQDRSSSDVYRGAVFGEREIEGAKRITLLLKEATQPSSRLLGSVCDLLQCSDGDAGRQGPAV